jgi:prepilin-type processing-associated H-X9-DG protein
MGRILGFIEQGNLAANMEAAYASQAPTPNPFLNPPHLALSYVVPVYKCPMDGRQYQAAYAKGITVAFTGYLGSSGTDLRSNDGVLYWNSQVRFADITDGTSNTLLVGERPPSFDLVMGWWYCGAGQWDFSFSPLHNSGSLDVVLGSAEINLRSVGIPEMNACPTGPYSYKPGTIREPCDQFHWWSLHPNGSNFLMSDGSVRSIGYAAKDLIPLLATRAGGEVVSLP